MYRQKLIRFMFAGLAFISAPACVTTTDETATLDGTSSGYFPEFAFDERVRNDSVGDVFIDGDYTRDWYSAQLRALGEPSFISTLNSNEFYYRFLWLRTFHNPIAIRVELNADSQATLFFRMASGAGGYDPGELINSESRRLTEAEYVKFRTLFARIDVCEDPPSEPLGNDGAQWVFERRKGNNYCVVERWTPQAGPHWELGRFMMELTGFKATNKQPIY